MENYIKKCFGVNYDVGEKNVDDETDVKKNDGNKRRENGVELIEIDGVDYSTPEMENTEGPDGTIGQWSVYKSDSEYTYLWNSSNKKIKLHNIDAHEVFKKKNGRYVAMFRDNPEMVSIEWIKKTLNRAHKHSEKQLKNSTSENVVVYEQNVFYHSGLLLLEKDMDVLGFDKNDVQVKISGNTLLRGIKNQQEIYKGDSKDDIKAYIDSHMYFQKDYDYLKEKDNFKSIDVLGSLNNGQVKKFSIQFDNHNIIVGIRSNDVSRKYIASFYIFKKDATDTVFVESTGSNKGELMLFGNKMFAKILQTWNDDMEFKRKETLRKEATLNDDDRNFRDKIRTLIEKDGKISDFSEDGVLEFPLLKKKIVAKSKDDVEKYSNKIQDIENDGKFKKLFDVGYIEKDEDVEQYNESTDVEDKGEDESSDAEQKEIDIANHVNSQLNILNSSEDYSKDSKFYACQVGGGYRSDILVVKDREAYNDGKDISHIPIKDGMASRTQVGHKLKKPKDGDDFFFIESKLNYETAQYLKFNMKLKFNNGSVETPMELEYSNNDDTYANLAKYITDTWKDNDQLKKQYLEFKKNIDTMIDSLLKIKNMKEMFSDIVDMKQTSQFPDDFGRISKIFNFYVLDWMNKLITFKQGYIYSYLNNDTEDIQRITKIVNTLKNKINYIGNGKSMSEIVNETYYDKFSDMYRIFISSQGGSSIGIKNTKMLFYINNIKNEDLFDVINNHYKNSLDVRYIEIENDIYKITGVEDSKASEIEDGNVMGENPFNLKDSDCKPFDILRDNTFDIGIRVMKDKNSKNGQVLRLDIRMNRPKFANNTNSRTFENIKDIKL